MNIFSQLWEAIQGNSKSVRLVFTAASLAFLTGVFNGNVSSLESVWIIGDEHWVLEHYVFDIIVACVVCLVVQSLCWMDTIRPLDKTSKAKQDQQMVTKRDID